MAGHVKRMGGVGRDRRVGPGGTEPERRVHGVVVGVDEVVGGARMIGVLIEHLFGDGRRAHVGGELAALVGGAEDGEGVERCGVEVVGEPRREGGEGLGVGVVARLFVALPVEHGERAEVVLLPRTGRQRQPLLLGGREPVEDGERGVSVLLHPDRMVVRQGLAPVGHGEVGIEALRLLKRRPGLGVLEGVQEEEPPHERYLRLRRPRVGEVGLPKRLGTDGGCQKDEEGEDRAHGRVGRVGGSIK